MAYGCLAVAAGALLSARLSEPEAAGALYSILLPYAGHIVAFTVDAGYLKDPAAKFLTGLEGWFTLPAQPGAPAPRRYKMAILTWVTIFPSAPW